jgi:plasmid replication initiation protein
MSARRHLRSERDQLELFRALPGDLAPRDAQDLMTYPFFSLAKTHRIAPIDYRMNDIAIRVEAVAEHGMATIWDADVLIWAASQIVEARDAGLTHVALHGSEAARDPDLRRPWHQCT